MQWTNSKTIVIDLVRIRPCFQSCFWLVWLLPETCMAHAGERGFIMLLPTSLFITTGTLAVLTSLIIVSCLPNKPVRRFWSYSKTLFELKSATITTLSSALTLGMSCLLIIAGAIGNPDPLKNPIGPIIWSWFWIGLVILHAIFGNLWLVLNPWRIMALLGKKLRSRFSIDVQKYPNSLSYWPAVALLLSFFWFENVSLYPYDPRVLSSVVSCYLIFNLCGLTIFGYKQWCRYVEIFSIYFRLVSLLSPFRWRMDRTHVNLTLVFPCSSLARHPALPISGVIFIVVTVAGITFDGGLRSFSWLGLIGVNPLEFAGRSQVLIPNTLGLVSACVMLAAVYFMLIFLGNRLTYPTSEHTGTFVLSMIPIAFGYHFAHYLPSFLLDAQYGLLALADPFDLGWNLFGLNEFVIYASVQSDFHNVSRIWYAQIAAISTCHIIAVLVCHTIATQSLVGRKQLFLNQLPFSLLMLFYTTLGLWLLSTPGI